VTRGNIGKLVATAFARLLIVLLSVRTIGYTGEQRCGGESVSQSPLKDQAFSTFLDQNSPFELRPKWNSTFDKNLCRSMGRHRQHCHQETSESQIAIAPLGLIAVQVSKLGMSRFERDSHAGDAVLIAPVSRRIPCKQGILQGNPQFWRLRRQFRRRKPLSRSGFSSISLDRITGKITRGTGNFPYISGNCSRQLRRRVHVRWRPRAGFKCAEALRCLATTPVLQDQTSNYDDPSKFGGG
jgi:hypothetical protein